MTERLLEEPTPLFLAIDRAFNLIGEPEKGMLIRLLEKRIGEGSYRDAGLTLEEVEYALRTMLGNGGLILVDRIRTNLLNGPQHV